MTSWSLESLGLAIAAIVLLMAATLVLAWNAAYPMQIGLLGLLAVLAILAVACAWRVRRLALSRSAHHDRSRALQRRYNHFVNTAHEGIWMVDARGIGIFANARLAEMFHCSVHQLLARPLQDFLGENAPDALAALLADHDGFAGRTYDLSYRRADGSIGWAIASGRPASAEVGMAGGTLLLLTDISVRKQAELELAAVKIGLEVRIRMRTAELQQTNEQLRIEVGERQLAEAALSESYAQLRQLTAHLETIKEEERKRIALDIHDNLGQNLMALKIDVQMLHARCAALPGLKDEVGRTLETIDASIQAARAIINELHPSTLELGLAAATEWLLTQFEQRSGIASSLTVRAAEDGAPDPRSAALVFRIIEESLSNIELYAGATQVEVLLAIYQAEVLVTVLDDGPGLYPGRADQRARAMFDRMRERIDVFGGTLSVQPRAGSGTCLTFRIPLTAQDAAGDAPAVDQSWLRYNNNDIEIN